MFLSWAGVVMGLILLLSAVGYAVSKKCESLSLEKSSPFECGFCPNSSSRMSFSLHFFLVALIFIVFDVELILLYPYILSFSGGGVGSSGELICFVLVVGFLSVGYLWEWSCEMLNWSW